MNFGYDKQVSAGWKEEKKQILAEKLAELVKLYVDKNGQSPYVEVDRMYPGVRIRRITHLTEQQHKKIVKKADAIYCEVMGIQVH